MLGDEIMEKTRIRVNIMGRGFNLVAGEEPEYLKSVALELDSRMRKLKNANLSLDYDMLAVLTALNLCDDLFTEQKNKATTDEVATAKEESNKIRKQLVEYSKELSRAESNIKRLERELKESRDKENKLKREWAAKEKEYLDMLGSM